tara:strand:+ start:5431 stop:6117 length:687 start_codon:yes stop_codon:yes gene_type:complete
MNKLSLTSLLIIITLGFSSCTQEESTFLEEPSAEDLLKSFKLNKSATGDYSLDYQLNNGAASDKVVDDETNTNNIYLYSSENESKSTNNEGLAIQDGELRISFNDTEKDKSYSITVLDDDIKSSKSENEGDLEYLNSYSIATNDDGIYTLDFKVNDGIAVDFIYDGDRDVYEIHLNYDENASQSDFLQSFNKEEGVSLNIEFFNNAEGSSKTMSTQFSPPQPVIIIED